MRNDESFWGLFMRMRYFPSTHPTFFALRLQDSNLWRRLNNIKEDAEKSIRWVLGDKDGRVSFWYDQWIGEEMLASTFGHDGSANLQVRDLWLDED